MGDYDWLGNATGCCATATVRHDLVKSYSAARPQVSSPCRECKREITLATPYYRCCLECPPLCVDCFQTMPEYQELSVRKALNGRWIMERIKPLGR